MFQINPAMTATVSGWTSSGQPRLLRDRPRELVGEGRNQLMAMPKGVAPLGRDTGEPDSSVSDALWTANTLTAPMPASTT